MKEVIERGRRWMDPKEARTKAGGRADLLKPGACPASKGQAADDADRCINQNIPL